MRSSALLPLLPLVALAAIGVGCGEEEAAGEASAPAAKESAPAAKASAGRTKVRVVRSPFGRVVADRRGEALYLFDRDGKRSSCRGECARVWPPALASGRPKAVGGARADLLGTVARPGGRRQLTYAGHPLYYYVHDSPGNILCHDVVEFGGRWLVVTPAGTPAP
jgi:predicted lipoprotein with Yx(FWY)xxD motif